MNIKEVRIGNLGKFTDYVINFKDGINFVYGENEAGKSTIFEALNVSVSGFNAIKNYKYMPFEKDRASVFTVFNNFSVERTLSNTVSGFLYNDGKMEKINNTPIFDLNRNIIRDIYTISSNDLVSISTKSIDEIMQSVLYDGNCKEYNSVNDMIDIIDKGAHDLYVNRSDSKKDINILREEIRELNNKIFDYNKKEEELEFKKSELKEVYENIDKKNDLLSKNNAKKNLLKKRLSNYDDYKKDNVSLINANFSYIPHILAVIVSLLLFLFNKLYFIPVIFVLYFLYKFVYFSNYIKFNKIFLLTKNKINIIKEIENELIKVEQDIIDISLNSNLKDDVIYEAKILETEIDNFYENNNIYELQQRLEYKVEKEKKLVLKYNRLLLLKEIFKKSKIEYLDNSLTFILDKASKYLSVFTSGKYNKILISSNKYYIKGVDTFLIDDLYLSSATKCQLYLALRLALVEYYDSNDGIRKPIFFDDAFVHFDEKRLNNTINSLIEISNKRQIILFVSRKIKDINDYIEL